MNKTIIIILFIVVLAVAGAFGYYQYKNKAAAALAVPPTNAFEADDKATYDQMLSIFKSADAGNQWDWMQEWVGKQYKGPGPLTLIQGKRTKTSAFFDVYSRMFYTYAAGGKQASEINGGAGYPLAGGYTAETLGATLYKMWIDFKTRNEYGI